MKVVEHRCSAMGPCSRSLKHVALVESDGEPDVTEVSRAANYDPAGYGGPYRPTMTPTDVLARTLWRDVGDARQL